MRRSRQDVLPPMGGEAWDAAVELGASLPRDVVVDSKVEEAAAKFGRIVADNSEATKASVLSAG